MFVESIGGGEWLVLLAVILIVVGPKNLPSTARKVGQVMAKLRRAADEFKRQLMTMDDEMRKAADDIKRDYIEIPEQKDAAGGEAEKQQDGGSASDQYDPYTGNPDYPGYDYAPDYDSDCAPGSEAEAEDSRDADAQAADAVMKPADSAATEGGDGKGTATA